MYINKLTDVVNECNNTYHRTIKLKPVDVKSSTENNDKDPKFEVGDHSRMSKYTNFCKKIVILQIGLKKVL